MSDATVVNAAAELLKAAILLRDIASAAPVSFRLSMPEDIRQRLFAYSYQQAFDALPEDVKAEARGLALRDPWVVEARRVDAEWRQA